MPNPKNDRLLEINRALARQRGDEEPEWQPDPMRVTDAQTGPTFARLEPPKAPREP